VVLCCLVNSHRGQARSHRIQVITVGAGLPAMGPSTLHKKLDYQRFIELHQKTGLLAALPLDIENF